MKIITCLRSAHDRDQSLLGDSGKLITLLEEELASRRVCVEVWNRKGEVVAVKQKWRTVDQCRDSIQVEGFTLGKGYYENNVLLKQVIVDYSQDSPVVIAR